LFAVQALATVFFSEDFSGDWESRWVKSKNKESEGTAGTWKIAAPKYGSEKGLQTATDARFYQISAKTPNKFSNKGKTLIVQYAANMNSIDCGGGYIKLHPTGLDQSNYNGDSTYNIMFGPDICGSSTKRTHLIFTYKGKNHLIKKDIRAENDDFTHVYTLILNPDNTYQVNIDGKEASKGSLKEDWDMLPPKEINDPSASKPSDWVDARQIPDPEDKKPEGWDDIPREIKDPEAKMPDDWDESLDGQWEAPMISNPEYKGEWRARQIDNPAYKGEWVHPKIANPDYKDDDNLYLYEDNAAVGFELWQVKSGTTFSHILVTDDQAEADKIAKKTLDAQEAEKKQKDKQDEEDRKKREAEEAAAKKDDDSHGGEKDEL
jgi:calreticulin